MSDYIYKCFSCRREYKADEIETSFCYLCPSCGRSEEDKPLEGVLSVEYDYNNLRKKLQRETILKLPPGKFWLYPDLWPVNFNSFPEGVLQQLALPSDLLLQYKIDEREIFIMDETRNPTLSYKDRASSLIALKAMELGLNEIAAASTGNAGSSIAGVCARLGMRSLVFVPSSIPDAKRIQIQSYGAKLFVVSGSYDDAFDLCLQVSSVNKWYNRNTAYNPLTIEGKKSGAYDIFISSKGNIPDTIIIPVGDGVIIAGIYKGFSELLKLGFIEKLPKLIAVQAAGSDALVRYINNGFFEFHPAKTIADSISAGAPRNLYMAAHCVRESRGTAISVSDDEILESQKIIAEGCGILAEPSSAVTLAGYNKLFGAGEMNNESVLLLVTGNGLKDISALNRWNGKPEAKSPAVWKHFFGME